MANFGPGRPAKEIPFRGVMLNDAASPLTLAAQDFAVVAILTISSLAGIDANFKSAAFEFFDILGCAAGSAGWSWRCTPLYPS